MLIKKIQSFVLIAICEIICKKLNYLINLHIDRFSFCKLFVINKLSNLLIDNIIGQIEIFFHNFL